MNFTKTESSQSTWYQGEVETTYAKLVEIFGKEHSDGDGYKIQARWELEFEDGTIATIYDWKEGDSYNGQGKGISKEQITNWHIGGTSPKSVNHIFDALNQCITLELAEVTEIKLLENNS